MDIRSTTRPSLLPPAAACPLTGKWIITTESDKLANVFWYTCVKVAHFKAKLAVFPKPARHFGNFVDETFSGRVSVMPTCARTENENSRFSKHWASISPLRYSATHRRPSGASIRGARDSGAGRSTLPTCPKTGAEAARRGARKRCSAAPRAGGRSKRHPRNEPLLASVGWPRSAGTHERGSAPKPKMCPQRAEQASARGRAECPCGVVAFPNPVSKGSHKSRATDVRGGRRGAIPSGARRVSRAQSCYQGQAMIEVYRIPVPKERLRALSRDERVLLLLLGHVSNQLSMLQKLIMFSTNKTPDRDFEQHATGVQTQMLVRLIVGAVNEAWQLVTTRFIQNPLQPEYLIRLDPPGREAFERLKRQFGRPLFAAIRNTFAYHYPSSDEAEEAFQSAMNDESVTDLWNLYFSRHGFNSLFLLSDLTYLHGIRKITNEQDLIAAQQKLMEEVSQASLDLVEFARSFFAAVWLRHFGEAIDARDVVRVEDAPMADEVVIPFFVDMG